MVLFGTKLDFIKKYSVECKVEHYKWTLRGLKTNTQTSSSCWVTSHDSTRNIRIHYLIVKQNKK